jgi:hypothetical protein
MLFTRYLADNNLLVDDQAGQPVTIDEVAEYAAELGEPDMWELAARFAAAMLPGIFRPDDPLLQMRLPVETTQRLEDLLSSLPRDVVTADDSLGWVYQYWQARRKDEVNRSERKIGGADLAPVTQLFTDDYMVRFLLENSLGAWWAARHPNSDLLAEWKYLRYADDGTPAAGPFDTWPRSAAQVTVMDPCCGSGHFLVAAFGMLWRMRAEEEGLPPVEAQDAVLRENLFGLEIDPRCVQIATFCVALQAWMNGGGWRQLPVPNIACSGTPVKAPVEEWTKVAAGDERLESALARLHVLFCNADTLGSLIDPKRAIGPTDPNEPQQSFESVDWDEVGPLIEKASSAEITDPAIAVLGAEAAGIARAADYLSRQYTLIATNVPYLSSVNQNELLKAHLAYYFADAKADLATAFIVRSRTLAKSAALVTPQNWLFLHAYRAFRLRLLEVSSLHAIARLGSGAFAGITGEVVKACLTIMEHLPPSEATRFIAVELDDRTSPNLKATALEAKGFALLDQADQQHNPDARIVLAPIDRSPLLQEYASAYWGLGTGDDVRFVRRFWELPAIEDNWVRHQGTVAETTLYGGRERILRWDGGRGDLANEPGAFIRGLEVWGSHGIAVSQTGSLPATLYTGEAWNQNCAPIIPIEDEFLPAIWAYCSSEEFHIQVRKIDQSLKVTNATLVKVPFDLERWQQVAEEQFPNGLPDPTSNDPTQWLFGGQPEVSTAPLQVAVARLLGYRWPEPSAPDDLDKYADGDGIVCLPPVGGEPPAIERLLQLLARAYGEKWSPAVLDTLLLEAGAKSGAAGLVLWLRNVFFKDHCRFFLNRPFIWHIWDGTSDGFSAFINYHRLDRRLLERLTFDYLGNWWLGRVRGDRANDLPGAEKRLAAAEQLKDKLQLILEGEPPYDIYVRWKRLTEQPVGWDPELDDGVRLNIRPFMAAGVLRTQPDIKWNKDRGKNPDGSDRLNDLHYTLAQKRAARETLQ